MILITGACGQLGVELAVALRAKYGVEKVITSDVVAAVGGLKEGEHLRLDVRERTWVRKVVAERGIKQIYHLVAILSASGETNPQLAWELNMGSLINVLEAAREYGVEKVFWPSSIAVFGPSSGNFMTSQYAYLDPITMYGISKLSGERWCEYYHNKYGLDVRSLRYPGIVSFRNPPGGGTTDYAVSIFRSAVAQESYECYLSGDTRLPMIYMDDAVRATLELMDAPKEKIRVRSSYNLTATSFTPQMLFDAIRNNGGIFRDFKIVYASDKSDPRQKIANSWPHSIDDRLAREDWGWKPEFDISRMTGEMLTGMAVAHPLAPLKGEPAAQTK
jgi:nucleoside-diphosphate-sugar epimerase